MDRVIVLFKVTLKEGKNDDYLKMAASLKDSLADAKGFIHSERFSSLATKGKPLSMSVWKDEESVTKWRNQAQHRVRMLNIFEDNAEEQHTKSIDRTKRHMQESSVLEFSRFY